MSSNASFLFLSFADSLLPSLVSLVKIHHGVYSRSDDRLARSVSFFARLFSSRRRVDSDPISPSPRLRLRLRPSAPGVPPTNIKVHLPMMSVVTLRGDRLASERIWWDQATLLSQLGLLPSHVPWSSSSSLSNEEEFIRLPVSGLEQAGKLVDEGEGESNEMMGEGWGVSSRK